MTQGKLEKDILSTASELGTQLASYHLEEAWTTAGRLHNLLKGTSKNTSRASRASNLSLIYSLFLVNFCL